MILNRPDLVAAAQRCAAYLLDHHLVDGRLRRTSLGGRISNAPAVADDHGNLAEGLLVLHQADGDLRWMHAATALLDTALDQFAAEDGGFHDTAADAEPLLRRPRDPADNAEPAGQSALAHALLAAAALTGETRLREAAEQAVAAGGSVARRDPRFAGWTLAAAEALLAGPLEVAVAAPDDASADPLVRTAWLSPSPGLVRVTGVPDREGVPLLANRPLVGAAPTAHLCRGFVCELPRTDAGDLEIALSSSAGSATV